MRIRRLPVDDELMIEGELVVLREDEVLLLSEVASFALHHLDPDDWTTEEELSDLLMERFGLPPDQPEAVSWLVSALSDARLVATVQD